MMSAFRLLLVPAIAFVVAFLAPDIAAAAQAGAAKPNQIKIDYVAPKNPAHHVIYRKLKEIRALENLREFLSPFRLPRTLLVKTEGCDGESNAWYEDGAITICYEYIEEIWRTAPSETTADGITPVDALFGPVTDTALHEFGHAIFEIYKLPVFGREEDAADQVAAYIELQLGKDTARRLIGGVAYAYFTEAKAETKTPSWSGSRTSTPRPRNACTMSCASPTAPTKNYSVTSWRRDISRRSGRRVAPMNTARPPSPSRR